jgi:hypothetical protein
MADDFHPAPVQLAVEILEVLPAVASPDIIPGDSQDAAAACRRQQAAIDKLNPAGGIRDDGEGTCRHPNNKPKGKVTLP